MVAESWFRSLWKPQRKQEGCPEAVIGVLAFEVASLMSKLIFLWKSLSDKHVVKMREEITNSVGIRKLISDDDDYIVGLICAEMMENVGHVARAVSRLAKKCNDSSLKSFEHVFNDLLQVGVDPYGWQFTWRTMDRKAKKMERLISTNGNLYREMESLSELEHTLRSMKGNDESDSTTLVEYEKKVAWKQQELKQLKEISLWNKTYDNAVHLLVRSLFTVHGRIGHVFGIVHVDDSKIQDSRVLDTDFTHRRSHSVSLLTQSSVHPSESSSIPRFSSGPLGNLTTKSGPLVNKNRKPNFYSGPIGNAVTASSSISRKSKAMNFFSGPLGRLSRKYGPLVRTKNNVLKFLQSRDLSSTLKGQSPLSKTSHSTAVGPFKGCMTGGNSSPVNNSYVVSGGIHSGILTGSTKGSLPGDNNHPLLNSKHRYLNTPSGTLGAAALALHYANVIIVIERLVAAPHLIGHDARDDLYNMLPARVRDSLRTRLKPFANSLTSSIYDTVLAEEWTEAMSGILEWLAPLAHNMIRWQSEKSFEHQNLVSRTNVLLVQTLYFADQEKTEATITEILVGLNYVWRFGRELNANAILECSSGRTLDGSLQVDG